MTEAALPPTVGPSGVGEVTLEAGASGFGSAESQAGAPGIRVQTQFADIWRLPPEVLAKAVFVLGLDAGMELLARERAGAVLVCASGDVVTERVEVVP